MDLLKIPIEKQNFEELRDRIQFLNDFYQSKTDNSLDKILNNPGLQHLAENVFDNLNFEFLLICQGINKSSKQILEKKLDKPMFVLKKFRGLSKKNQRDWIKVIEAEKNSEKERIISSYLQWILKKDVFVDLPCYTSSAIQDDLRKTIWESCTKKLELTNEDVENVKILAPLVRDTFFAQVEYFFVAAP